MPVSTNGAQRASRHRTFRLVAMSAIAAVVAVGGLAAQPRNVEAAGKKVVIVVGPAGSNTSDYISNAKKLASQARSYGATVYEIYTPHATWSRVKSLSQGANVFIYLGHGNGSPSPYGPFNKYTEDGLGLNSCDGCTSHTYYGEYYVQNYLHFAADSVVILNRLCYASGNSEWGAGYPTKTTAIARVDNFGGGFLRTGARAVFAEGIDSVSFVLYGLFKTNRSMKQIFWSDPAERSTYAFAFASKRNPGKWAIVAPEAPSHYYKSVIGDVNMTASTWRN